MNKIDVYKDLKAAISLLPGDVPGREQLLLLSEKLRKDVESQLPKHEEEEVQKILSDIILRAKKDRATTYGAWLLPGGDRIIYDGKMLIFLKEASSFSLKEFDESVPEETRIQAQRIKGVFEDVIKKKDVYPLDPVDIIRGEMKGSKKGDVIRKFDDGLALYAKLYLEASIIAKANTLYVSRKEKGHPGLFFLFGDEADIVLTPCWNVWFSDKENGFFGCKE